MLRPNPLPTSPPSSSESPSCTRSRNAPSSIWGTGNALSAVGKADGLRFDGSKCARSIAGTRLRFKGVWGSGPIDVFVINAHRTAGIMRWCGPVIRGGDRGPDCG